VEVRSIDREEFLRLYPYTGKITAFIGEGAEWFTNDARSVVGIVTRDSIQPAWNYAVLRRNVVGDFQVTHLGNAGSDLQRTREECRLAMTVVESVPETKATAPTVSPLGPPPQFQFPDKGRPLVVLLVLAGDIITIAFVLLWVFRWR
jgi:hypothetical protein